MKKQHYMTRDERYKLEAYLRAGKPVAWIARDMGFCERTIYYEKKRGQVQLVRNPRGYMIDTIEYSADKAQQKHEYDQTAKGRPLKIGNDRAYAEFLERKILTDRFSPAAALAAARRAGYQTSVCVSTLYSYIDKGIFLHLTNKNLWVKGRKKKRGYQPVRRIAHPLLPSITTRPEDIKQRSEFGHWEMDLVVGKAGTKPVLLKQSMQSYLDSLDEEFSKQPGFKKPPTRIIKKRRTTSQTDPDSGYINHGSKRGVGYLMEATVDCKHGILTGVDVYPANEKESLLVLRHLERQIKLGVPMRHLALDRGYETGAVHRGLELLGISGYIPAIRFSNPPEKYGFFYDPKQDAFICPEGIALTYHRLNCNKSTGKYLRCYQVDGDSCMRCPRRPGCFDKAGLRRRVLASSCYPAFYRGHQRLGSPAFLAMMRLRKIWAEGSFSVLKREHCISKIRKRGIPAATEECLLAAMALNLKRMAKAVFYKLKIRFNWAGVLFFSPSFLLLSTGPLSYLITAGQAGESTRTRRTVSAQKEGTSTKICQPRTNAGCDRPILCQLCKKGRK